MTIRPNRVKQKLAAGEVAIIPAGSSWSCRAQGAHLRNALLLYLRPLFVRSAAANFNFSYKEIALTPQLGFRNQHILHVALSLLHELHETNVVDRGGMSPHKLRKAVALIDQHLAVEEEGRVSLRVVAREVGISYSHFSRAFKQSIGMSPTNYIAERRIERAKKLMQETDLPISEIAIRSGFSSQSHFTTSFRRFAKVTPSSFRKGT